jgi:hypothetical protein
LPPGVCFYAVDAAEHRRCWINSGSAKMSELATVFTELRAILRPYATRLEVAVNSDGELYVNTRHIQKNKKPLFFGAVSLKKNYVSFHLMPVYVRPQLLDNLSPDLKARMQGKSCFNFTKVNKPLFNELAVLTQSGFASYREQGFV